MIERNNPYKSVDGNRLTDIKVGGAKIISAGLLSAMLFTGCGKDAVDELKPVTEQDTVPENAMVYVMDDGTYWVDGNRVVKFKDKAFQKYFDNRDLNYYLTPTVFHINLFGPKSLNELNLFLNLRTVSIYDCDLKDFSMLSEFQHLKGINLSNCDNIEDFSFLVNHNLENISFEEMDNLSDLSFLKGLSSLKNLTIGMCPNAVIDPEIIKTLNLTSLSLSCVTLEDLSCISDMSNLERINISYSNLQNLQGISNAKSLKSVYLRDCLVTDASDLYGLTNLEVLDISNNSIHTLDLTKFPNLKRCSIKYNYALYTDEFLEYCKNNNIATDITREDVDCMNQVRAIVQGLELDGLSDAEKEDKIYTYILEHMEYDKKYDSAALVEYNERELYHALQGNGVCANYAALFDAMCETAGIHSFQLIGYAKAGLTSGPHAWNLVEIDGQMLLCDATWSDSLRSNIDYKILHMFEKKKTDKYYNQSGDNAEDFMDDHVENAYNRKDDGSHARGDAALGITSVQTTDENGEKVSGAVIAGIVGGTVAAVGGTAAAYAIVQAKKRKKRAERRRREQDARNRGYSTHGYNNGGYGGRRKY